MGAESRGWGPGWPNCQTGKLVTLTAGARGLRLPVRAEVAPIFAALITDLEDARGEPFRPDWSWGFACRAISGTSTPSNHSWGLAIDLDAPENPYQRGVPGPGRNTMPSNASTLAAKYGCRWGGDYRYSADPMHFEFMGSPAYAQTIIERYDLRAGEEDMTKLTQITQRALNAAGYTDDDGDELTVDGIPGDKTGQALEHAFRAMRTVELLQESVKASGHDPGPIDGLIGNKTRDGLTDALKSGSGLSQSDADGRYARKSHGHEATVQLD